MSESMATATASPPTKGLRWIAALGLVAAALAVAVVLFSMPAKSKVALGSRMPDFTLNDIEGNQHSLAEATGKYVVINFVSQECPFSRGVDPGFEAIVKEYAPKGVVFYCIDSHELTTPEQIQSYVREHGLTATYLKDAGNVYADLTGATKTPELFILDKNLNLVYHGAYDNRWTPERAGATNYLKEALDSLLAGQPVQNAETKAWGCSIKRVSKPSA